jgi:SPP1 family predicted phage head-tail adaptor
MKIGDLKRRMELQAPTDSMDDLGQPVRTWSTYATIWAQISPISVAEGLFGSQLKGLETHSILIRWRDDVRINHRMLYEGRIFLISSVRNLDENRQALAIAATEWLESPSGVMVSA